MFNNSSETERKSQVEIIANEFGPDIQKIRTLTQGIRNSTEENDTRNLMHISSKLQEAAHPVYLHLFKGIANTSGGVKFLVDLRSVAIQVARMTAPNPAVKELAHTLKELLSLWFAVGLLQLTPVSWNTSASMLEKVSQYEEVHQERVGPYRRCFVFTHYTMPGEPLVILHTYLTNSISSCIHNIINRKWKVGAAAEVEIPVKKTVAVFYSIQVTQDGLHGIDLGNYLIKKAVGELSLTEGIQTFSTLSPIPGFREWLLAYSKRPCNSMILNDEEMEMLQTALGTNSAQSTFQALVSKLDDKKWTQDVELRDVLRSPLLRLCYHYICIEKRRGYAVDPVAHFHLKNGAVVWRLNYLADETPSGMKRSYGIMANYRYYPETVERNSEEYILLKKMVVSDNVICTKFLSKL